jgi:hypothetical protein
VKGAIGFLLFLVTLLSRGYRLTSEFTRRLELLGLDEQTKKKLADLIAEAGAEFPCLACPSNDTCENFKWYIKWFKG